MAAEHWKDKPDKEDYPSAASFLSLLVGHDGGVNTSGVSKQSTFSKPFERARLLVSDGAGT
jgi:hypothetical protein